MVCEMSKQAMQRFMYRHHVNACVYACSCTSICRYCCSCEKGHDQRAEKLDELSKLVGLPDQDPKCTSRLESYKILSEEFVPRCGCQLSI